MADTEKKVVLTVGTGNSQKTVKGLKDEINQLRDALLNMDKGSDEYNDAVTKLQTNQRKLNEVMALTKKEATALDGSYDALVHKMSTLKKEWRATADEAERANIGGQIDEINSKLKEMDASVGNFQRNVGNYVSHWEGMPEAIDDVAASVQSATDDMASASAAPKDFGVAMREMNESIEPTAMKFESISNIASGLASGFAAVQGAAALFGMENENLQKTLVKVQAAMALAQGIGGLKSLVEGIGRAKVAFAGLGDKIKAVSKTMGTAGWLGVILTVTAAIGALVMSLKDGGEEAEEFAKKQEEIKEQNDKVGESIGDVVAEYKLLRREYLKLDTNDEKLEWIKENASAFEELGLNIKTVNEADEALIKNNDKVIAALKARAKAEALTGLYKEQVVKAEQEKQNLQLPTYDYKNTQDASQPIEYTGPAKWRNYYKQHNTSTYQTTVKSQSPTGGYRTLSLQRGYWEPTITAEEAYNIPALQAEIQKMYDEIDKKYLAAIEKSMDAAQEEALEKWKGLGDIGKTGGNENGNGGDGKKTLEQIRDEIVAANWDFINQVTEEQIAALDDDIVIEDEDFDDTNKDGQAEKWASDRIAYKERVSNREIEDINNASKAKDIEAKTEKKRLKIEEERAAKEYAIREKLEQDKLKLLKEAHQQAMDNYDVEGIESLAQQIADQEIAIEKTKYDELKRLRDKDREDRKKTLDSIVKTTTVGLQATSDILTKVAESYERDGEVSEKEAKKLKSIRYATTVIDMMQGIVSAMASAAGGGAAGWIAGGIQAASIATAGAISLKAIEEQDFKTTGNAPVLPSAYQSELPFNYTRQLTGAQEYEALNKDTKVYVLESDISDAMHKVSVRENESSF